MGSRSAWVVCTQNRERLEKPTKPTEPTRLFSKSKSAPPHRGLPRRAGDHRAVWCGWRDGSPSRRRFQKPAGGSRPWRHRSGNRRRQIGRSYRIRPQFYRRSDNQSFRRQRDHGATEILSGRCFRPPKPQDTRSAPRRAGATRLQSFVAGALHVHSRRTAATGRWNCSGSLLGLSDESDNRSSLFDPYQGVIPDYRHMYSIEAANSAAKMNSNAPLGSEFDNFLFAPIGVDKNGMVLSVVSALARLDVDPWEEAEELAHTVSISE